jgi:EpsI family protein
MKRRHAIAASLVMGSGALAAHAMRPTRFMSEILPAIELENLIPKRFGDWQLDPLVRVVLPSPDVQAALNAVYNQVLSRTYVNSQGERIMLSVAYGGDQSDGTKIHRPENCYPGQGFSITANRVDSAELPGGRLPVRRLMSQLPPRFEPITYWMMVGEVTTLSSAQNKLVQMRLGLRGFVPDGLLVRISSISREPQLAYPVHDQFAQAMYAAIGDPAMRRRLFGF